MTEQFVCSKMFTDINIKFPYSCVKNCCKSQDYKVPLQEVVQLGSDVFNLNKEYLNRKKTMLFENKLPDPGCEDCVNTEPNSLFRSWNTWRSIIPASRKEELLYEDNHTTFELVLNSACDLKCVYCGPKDSTSWAKELNQPINAIDKGWKDTVLHNFIEYLKKRDYPEDDYWFFFSGGEPTYNTEVIEVIERIIAVVPNEKLNIIISTNGNTKQIVLERYINAVREHSNVKWVFDVSLDALHERCEAIRYGLNFETAIKNIKTLITEPNIKIRISPTINIFSVPYLTEFVIYFDKLFKEYDRKVDFNYNMVQNKGMSPMNLPLHYRSYFDSAIKYCKDNDIHYYWHLESVQNLIATEIAEDTWHHISKHIKYFENKRPDVRWRELFPHLEELMKSSN